MNRRPDVVIVRDVDGRQYDQRLLPWYEHNSQRAIAQDHLSQRWLLPTDAASCAYHVTHGGCMGHYSWNVTFRRAY